MLKKRPTFFKRSDSDVVKPTKSNSFGRKTSVPSSSEPKTYILPIEVKELSYPLTMFINRSVAMKGANILQVREGDVVTFLNSINSKSQMVNVQKGNEKGNIPSGALCLNKHVWNIYLDTVEILIQHPDLLLTLLENTDFPDIVLQLVPTLIARRQLEFALSIFFQSELLEKKAQNELFRLKTPAVTVVTTIFNNPQNLPLQKFRTDFVNFVISLIHKYGSNLTIIVENSINYLVNFPIDSIPPELCAVLKSLNGVITDYQKKTLNISVLLGSMFFLRFICPALSQPHEFCNIQNINGSTKSSLIAVTKVLQLISNQTVDNSDTNLIKLYDPVSQFLMKLASKGTPTTLSIENSLIVEAATLYYAVYHCAEKYHNDPALKQIVEKLGVPKIPVFEQEVPMYSKIVEIKNYIESLT